MRNQVKFCLNKATEKIVSDHLMCCDADFVPPLHERINIVSYAKKIYDKATRFEAWSDGVLIGLVAIYCNDSKYHAAFITSVSVLREWRGEGIASQLIEQCILHVGQQGFDRIELEVDGENASAVKLYKEMGFSMLGVRDGAAIMCLYNVKNE